MEISLERLFSSKPRGNFLSTCISFRKPFTCVAIARNAQRGGFVGRAAARRVRERSGGPRPTTGAPQSLWPPGRPHDLIAPLPLLCLPLESRTGVIFAPCILMPSASTTWISVPKDCSDILSGFHYLWFGFRGICHYNGSAVNSNKESWGGK